jgi:hypothetical protein
MPTPFTHLHYAQRALRDPALPASACDLLTAHLPEYLLGSVVADGQGQAGLPREATHFYSYDRPIDPLPHLLMLERHPALRHPDPAAARACIAGYVFHLAMDAWWTLHMTAPHFGRAAWGDRALRFLMLHVLLVQMDERDYAALDPALAGAVGAAQPGDWLPFLPLEAVRGWQALIDAQVRAGGVPLTYEVMAPRVGMTPEALRALTADAERVESNLWTHVPRALLAEEETGMYAFALDALIAYLT